MLCATGEFATNGDYTFADANYVAVYPYNDNITVSGTTVTMTLPAVQTAHVRRQLRQRRQPDAGHV